MNFVRSFIVLIITLLTLTSCDKSGLFDSYVTIPNNGWDKDSMAVYRFEIRDIQKSYNLLVNVRNDAEYENQNLYLFIDVTAPNGKTERDTLDCILADASGKWLGSGLANYYQTTHRYKSGVKFPEIGEYTVRYVHGMRADKIGGIRDIGLRVERANY